MEWKNVQVMSGVNPDVWKYIFENDTAIAEAVLYRYGSFETRTVICCSVQSGCPVGCVFCGTGKHFVRNLTAAEIVAQVEQVLIDKKLQNINSQSELFQIMFMSMGEPMLNWGETKSAIEHLALKYPNAKLLLSTVGIDDEEVMADMIETSKTFPQVGLQISLHSWEQEAREKLIPFHNLLKLRPLRDFALRWWKATGRKVQLNYLVQEPVFSSSYQNFYNLFSKECFAVTLSCICNPCQDGGNFREQFQLWTRNHLQRLDDYEVRLFDPAGQDDIGGGCGQLWYVQKWLREHQ